MTEGATPQSQGELPWRTAFGAGLARLRHQRNEAALAELARVYIRDALRRWAHEAEVADIKITQDDAGLNIAVRVRKKTTGTDISAEVTR